MVGGTSSRRVAPSRQPRPPALRYSRAGEIFKWREAKKGVMDMMSLALVVLVFIVGLIIVLSVAFALIKKSAGVIGSLLVNTVVGFIAIVALNLIGAGIPYSLPVIISTALFGIGAVGTILILKVLGGVVI